ncbi:MAG: 50S ribosomal protein L23 [Promethearchaeota archaeon CR_4]|nr:MAG: 50S ribosomal protein L23 [Candidatus Lokiarchaeota archaeon CR_4]
MSSYYNFFKRPVVTENTFSIIEEQNKLVFIVDRTVNKAQIKEAFEKIFKVKVKRVNSLITPQGEKKAFVKISPEFSASDIAINLGIF